MTQKTKAKSSSNGKAARSPQTESAQTAAEPKPRRVAGEPASPVDVNGVGVLSAIVRAARHARGMTQVEFAEACGVPQSSVSHWEGGRRPLVETTLVKVASGLGLTVPAMLALGIERMGWAVAPTRKRGRGKT